MPELARAARALLIPVAVSIAWLSLKPLDPLANQDTGLLVWVANWALGDADQSDKVGHTLAYAALAFTAYLGYAHRMSALRILILAFAYGAFLELCQLPLTHRTLSVADLLANNIGAITGLALGWLVRYGNSRILS